MKPGDENSRHERSSDSEAADERAPAESELAEGQAECSKSALSMKLDRLKSATLKVVHSRERLPQPLFWSLFHAEVESIKEKRKKQREMLAALYNIDWL